MNKELLGYIVFQKNDVINIISVIAFFGIILSCFPKWTKLWKDFGKNLYHFIENRNI